MNDRTFTSTIVVAVLAAALPCLAGCVSATDRIMGVEQSAVQKRSYQQRAFDTTDLTQTMRSVMDTLQDLGFVLDNADHDLGLVTATRLDRYNYRVTVTVRPRGTTQMLVRVSMESGTQANEELKDYQDFFSALEKSMFLTAQQVE
jgi:hypothetical protein